jgi:2-methylisocitrate lyase-like PEP mutase family enzyme
MHRLRRVRHPVFWLLSIARNTFYTSHARSPAARARLIYNLSLAVERIKAAVEAARALAFLFTLVARVANFVRGNPHLDDTIKRLVAYEKAGADVLFAPGLSGNVYCVCRALRANWAREYS